jgi:hypothetical protein
MSRVLAMSGSVASTRVSAHPCGRLCQNRVAVTSCGLSQRQRHTISVSPAGIGARRVAFEVVSRRLRPAIAAATALLLGAATIAATAGVATPGPDQPAGGQGAQSVVQADPFTQDAPGLKPGQIEMTTVSTRPGLVTGGVARVAIRGLQPDDRLAVTRNDADVTAAFAPVASRPGQAAGAVEGLVTGLQLGGNDLEATATNSRYGTRTVHLDIENHSLQGPIISGPHQQPYLCDTVRAGLGPAGPDCVAPAHVDWWYADHTGQFHQLADPRGAYPPDMARTVVNGQVMPFVVRVESEVINRSITRIAVLDDPQARGDRPFTPVEWNHRLVYQFGQSCGTGHRQGDTAADNMFGDLNSVNGDNTAAPLIELTRWLARGGMVAESTLTTFYVSCNQITSAETLMMVKEHIVDDYGDITHTIGAGSSGGAIQQYTAADGYPGLLDAGTTVVSFPDLWSTAMTIYACANLEHVFEGDPNRWTSAKQVAVTGTATAQVCLDWRDEFAPVLNPYLCPGGIPAADVYNPTTNPGGVRCDLQDDLVNILGVDPSTGFAYRPIDDAGVQYGLRALQAGQITLSDFIELNRGVGGLDIDFNHVSSRATMPDAEAHRMYVDGLISGRGALNQTPIIDMSIPPIDYTPQLDIHEQVEPFQTRARLDAYFGSHASQAIWNGEPFPSNALYVAQRWLTKLDQLQAQHPTWDRAQLVAAGRPIGATDQCRAVVVGVPIACDHGVLTQSNPRQVAGGPLTEDNIDCRLRPIRAGDYPGTTAADLQQIQGIFPTGVCDFSRPAVGWTARAKTWLTYGADGVLLTDPVPVPYPIARSRVP